MTLDYERYKFEHGGEYFACCFGSFDFGPVYGTYLNYTCQGRFDVVLRHYVGVFIEEV